MWLKKYGEEKKISEERKMSVLQDEEEDGNNTNEKVEK